jgi:hypothetical protein
MPNDVPIRIEVTDVVRRLHQLHRPFVGFSFRTNVHGTSLSFGTVAFGTPPGVARDPSGSAPRHPRQPIVLSICGRGEPTERLLARGERQRDALVEGAHLVQREDVLPVLPAGGRMRQCARPAVVVRRLRGGPAPRTWRILSVGGEELAGLYSEIEARSSSIFASISSVNTSGT